MLRTNHRRLTLRGIDPQIDGPLLIEIEPLIRSGISMFSNFFLSNYIFGTAAPIHGPRVDKTTAVFPENYAALFTRVFLVQTNWTARMFTRGLWFTFVLEAR